MQIEQYTDPNGNLVGNRSHMLSGLARQASDSGRRIHITPNNVITLLDSVVIPKTPLENMDRALVYVSERQQSADDEPQVFYDKEYPLVFARGGSEFRYFMDNLVDRGYLKERSRSPGRSNQFYQLTPQGWEKIEQLRLTRINSNQAFVAMWFSPDMKNAWEDGFKPALESTGYDPLRVDLKEYNGKIDDFIVAQIRRSGLMVADFTGQRGGVYYEAGLAQGLGIPVIFTCVEADLGNLHFDTRQYNHIQWKEPADLRDKLQNRIAATIPGRIIRA